MTVTNSLHDPAKLFACGYAGLRATRARTLLAWTACTGPGNVEGIRWWVVPGFMDDRGRLEGRLVPALRCGEETRMIPRRGRGSGKLRKSGEPSSFSMSRTGWVPGALGKLVGWRGFFEAGLRSSYSYGFRGTKRRAQDAIGGIRSLLGTRVTMGAGRGHQAGLDKRLAPRLSCESGVRGAGQDKAACGRWLGKAFSRGRGKCSPEIGGEQSGNSHPGTPQGAIFTPPKRKKQLKTV